MVFKKGGGRKKLGKKGIATVPKAGFGALSAVMVQRSGAILAAGSGDVPSYDAARGRRRGGDALLVRLKRDKRDRTFARGGAITTDVRAEPKGSSPWESQPGGRIVCGNHGYYYFRGPTDQQAMVAGDTAGANGRRRGETRPTPAWADRTRSNSPAYSQNTQPVLDRVAVPPRVPLDVGDVPAGAPRSEFSGNELTQEDSPA